MLKINDQSTIKLGDQSTVKLGDQLIVHDTNSSTAHHLTSKEQNYNQMLDKYTTKVRTRTEPLESERSTLHASIFSTISIIYYVVDMHSKFQFQLICKYCM